MFWWQSRCPVGLLGELCSRSMEMMGNMEKLLVKQSFSSFSPENQAVR